MANLLAKAVSHPYSPPSSTSPLFRHVVSEAEPCQVVFLHWDHRDRASKQLSATARLALAYRPRGESRGD